MRFSNLLVVVLAAVILAACGHIQKNPEENPVTREYLLAHDFEGTWKWSNLAQGPNRLKFVERNGMLFAVVDSTNIKGQWGSTAEVKAEISDGVVTFHYNGPMELWRTEEGLRGIQQYKDQYRVVWRLQPQTFD